MNRRQVLDGLTVLATAGAVGKQAALCQERVVRWNVPDGLKHPGVEHITFRSPAMGIEVGCNVYVPDGYADSTARYPAIYFLHGAGGTEQSDAGAFSGLVGRMVREQQAPPAICVFPNGGMSGYRDRPDQKVMGETLIVRELVPLIDRKYRTRATREGRALAGFSMGGGGAVRLSLKYPELFSAAASWAGALRGRGGDPPPELEADALRKVAGKVRLLLIVGDKDLTFAGHAPVVEALKQAGFPFEYRVLEGVPHDLGQYYEKTGAELVRFVTAGFAPVSG